MLAWLGSGKSSSPGSQISSFLLCPHERELSSFGPFIWTLISLKGLYSSDVIEIQSSPQGTTGQYHHTGVSTSKCRSGGIIQSVAADVRGISRERTKTVQESGPCLGKGQALQMACQHKASLGWTSYVDGGWRWGRACPWLSHPGPLEVHKEMREDRGSEGLWTPTAFLSDVFQAHSVCTPAVSRHLVSSRYAPVWRSKQTGARSLPQGVHPRVG